MNIPFQSLHFIIYEYCQDKLNAKHEYNPLTHCISGATAGGVAAAVTTPLDVCKTLLNTQHPCRKQRSQLIRGLIHAAQTVYRVSSTLMVFTTSLLNF